MGKILEKALRDAMKEDACTVGARQVLARMGGSKLVVISRSRAGPASEGLEEAARGAGVPAVRFDGTSMALGKLCGLQYRASAVSFDSLPESGVASIVKEAGQ